MQKKNISSPKVGMNRDTHIDLLKPTDYTLAVNANTENESGEKLNIFNEPSNYLSLVLPSGYKVIGFKYNILDGRTYLMLTNPTTKKSSIGYIENTEIDQTNVDAFNNTNCLECDPINELGIPLEDVTQSPYNTYNELINDTCFPVGEGLNFSLDFPIKNLEIKNEKGEVIGYWDDYNNPSRYMVFSDVSYLFNIEVPCGQDIPTECPILDKLLHFPNFSVIELQPELLQIGGNLKLGTYEFWACYCDAQGNEISNYFTPTQPIDIFDENNTLLEQTELDSFTNFSIKIKVNNLDTKFPYYKVVCVERTNVNNTQSAFLEGIHPTSDDTIVYSSSGTSNDDEFLYNGNYRIRRRVDLYELQRVRPTYEKAVGTVSSGNMLWKWGLKEKDVMNLQPVINLFGSLLRWQSTAVKEDLYKSPIASSKYKSYPRDEVQPFSIRFFTKDGEYTPTFPFIGRPLMNGENDTIDDINYQSLSNNTVNCTSSERNKKWQIFNTASEIERVGSGTWDCSINFSGTTSSELITKVCKIENVATIPTGTVTINNPIDFTTLSNYIKNNPTITIPGITEYLEDTYPESHCTPNFTNCDTPELISSRNELGTIIGETAPIYTTKPTNDYLKSVPPSFCNNFKRNTETGGFIEDNGFEASYMNCGEIVYLRDFDNIQNESCSYALPVINNNIPTQATQSIYHNYYGSDTLSDLLSAKNSFVSDSDFNVKLHKGALWFKVDKLTRDKFILEVTKLTTCINSDGLSTIDKLRYNIYTDCTSNTPLIGDIFQASTGLITEIDCTTFPNTFYVAIDAPIVSEVIPYSCSVPSITKTVYRVSPPCGCFSIYTRDVEYSSLNVSWDSITINKYETYRATCNYFLPIVDDCNPVPYANGEFAYWESTETYSDNSELFDSSHLHINTNDLNLLTSTDRQRFESFYTNSVGAGGYYNLNPNTDFRCTNIRHPKMPDNVVSPFMIDSNFTPFAETMVFPLGITIDPAVVKTALQIAYNNGLITLKQLNSIEGYEILRGDNTVNKSILANGLGYDMYKYSRDNKDYLYANYPFNDLGNDILHYQDSSRQNLVEHPFSGSGNNKFSIISPDLLLNKPTLSTEVVLSGYQIGNAKGRFTEVREHPKWTILGKKARTTADVLAVAEVALETAIKIAENTSQQWSVGGASIGFSLGFAGVAIASIAYGIQGFVRVGQYRYQWLETFRNLGAQYNFAHYNVAEGYHNNFIINNSTNDYIRGISLSKYLKDGEFQFVDEKTSERLLVNNYSRESSALISLGNSSYKFNYDPTYANYDNSNSDISSSSRTIASNNSCNPNEEYTRNVGSPYFTLKNYIPDQWGTIDSIKWLTTNSILHLENTSGLCNTIFGGTFVISRFTDKRKVPMFKSTAMKLPNKLAVEYLPYKNIAEPRFYCDYETDTQKNILGVPFPDINSNFEFDCENVNGFYIKPDSKFYLYYYGITSFLVESEINCNFRYGKREPKNQFFNQNTDIVEWTQEVVVPIKEPNTFYYNDVYSLPVSNSPYRYLDNSFSKALWNRRALQENAVIYSEVDNSQNAIFDPWRVYKPLNWYEFDKKNGRLIALKDLESSQLLGRFENSMTIFNAIDSLADRITPQNKTLGTGGVFATRPLEFKKTDLGFSGTQHTDMVSTPIGHFWVDAKRGKIFLLDQSGKSLDVISEMVGGQPTNMKNWFKEHLPMQILKQLPMLDIDNKFKGIGFNIYYDSRFERVFITKRDYVLKPGVVKTDFYYDEPTRKLYYREDEIFYDNSEVFEDISWTIAFKAGEGWSSYYTFYPDYSISYNDYFQVGYNFGNYKETLWTHNLGKASFQVFQGELNPFIVEYPIINENTNKILNSISLGVESKRWQSEWDFSQHSEIGFNKAIIWNNTNNSHLLNLIEQRTLSQVKDYPITRTDSQDILFTNEDGRHNLNYFYNRIKNNRNNIPPFIYDKNRIFKTVNSQAVSFTGKPILERMRGEAFIVTLINDKESRFNIALKNSINTENTYE